MCSFICCSHLMWCLHSASSWRRIFSYSLCAAGMETSLCPSPLSWSCESDTFESEGELTCSSLRYKSWYVLEGDCSNSPMLRSSNLLSVR